MWKDDFIKSCSLEEQITQTDRLEPLDVITSLDVEITRQFKDGVSSEGKGVIIEICDKTVLIILEDKYYNLDYPTFSYVLAHSGLSIDQDINNKLVACNFKLKNSDISEETFKEMISKIDSYNKITISQNLPYLRYVLLNHTDKFKDIRRGVVSKIIYNEKSYNFIEVSILDNIKLLKCNIYSVNRNNNSLVYKNCHYYMINKTGYIDLVKALDNPIVIKANSNAKSLGKGRMLGLGIDLEGQTGYKESLKILGLKE